MLRKIINDFDLNRFTRFFREKNRAFAPKQEELIYYDDENFRSGLKLGEIKFTDDEEMIICAFEVTKQLIERSGKKAQYEKAKKILKETQYDSGIFIFYDQNGNFRFSLIYANYLGRKRDWSNFRRFTYFVCKEFTNKTFLQRIGDGDFSSLEKIKDAFSVEKVTKEFYESIANWYFWAVEHCQFPKDAEAEENGRNIAVIRLITRIIFIWFMRERGLVPKYLFEEKNIAGILKSIFPEDSTYYTAILQNLFFATLSTKKDERKFRSEIRGYIGYNPDFGNQNVFRFQELFKNPEKLKDYFGEIPFLNGGLFECLDDKPNGIYIDGFTAVKKNQPIVPNFLFISGEQKADINTAYRTKNKTFKDRGLLDILSSYNFTIYENSPDDQDIALDPELLGRVFENLLASFNPETSTTARRATGSYYTPREIVDYMVTESLKKYFKTHLSSISDLDKKIEQLFSTGNKENPFYKSESKKIVELIESVRIVDPAVGSGAFPMGALNKLVFILNKVDPGNELWKQAQLKVAEAMPDQNLKAKTIREIENYFQTKKPDYWRKLYLIQKCIYGVDIQQIAVEIAKLRFFISLLVHEEIDKTKENWGIEPLPNLDFKIMQGNSLLEEYEGVKLFDEKFLSQTSKQEILNKISKIDLQLKENDSQRLKFYKQNPLWMKNRQIEKPMKLLELENNRKVIDEKKTFLINELKNFDLPIKQEELRLYKKSQAKSFGEELEKLHKDFFEANEKEKKDEIKKQIENLNWELIEATLKEQNKTSELKKIEQFKKSNTKPFFLWKLYFAEVFQGDNPGFDIVIANPPFIDSETMVKESPEYRKKISTLYITASGNWDIYIPFWELGIKLLSKSGNAVYITPNKWLAISYGKELRKLMHKYYYQIGNCNKVNVFEAGNSPVVVFISKNKFHDKVRIDVFDKYYKIRESAHEAKTKINDNNWGILLAKHINLIIKINLNRSIIENNYYAENPFTVSEAYEIKNIIEDLDKSKNVDSNKFIKFINTGTIEPYFSLWRKKVTTYIKTKYYKPIINKKNFKEKFPKRYKQMNTNKIIISGMRHFEALLDDNNEFVAGKSTVILKSKNDNLKIVLGILNSQLITFFIKEAYNVLGIDGGINFTASLVENLPFPNIDKILENKIIKLVENILTITKPEDYLDNPGKQEKVKELEKEIDKLVYELYGLTEEDIRIVEGNKK